MLSGQRMGTGRRMLFHEDCPQEFHRVSLTSSWDQNWLKTIYKNSKASEILESIFQSRPLESRYIAIFLDALFFFLRRDTVEKEPILFAMGIRESGEYEIMGFYLASKESHLSYTAVINDLYDRGVREPLLFIADGIPKLDEEIRKVFPRADFQLCTIHASRNFESEVRELTRLQ